MTADRPAARLPGGGQTARGGVALGLATALLATVGVWLTWRVFVDTAAGQRVDQAVFEGARYGQNALWRVAEPVLEVVSVPFIALVLVAAVLIAVVRRRWGLAAQVVLLMGGANLTTQVLKKFVLDRPDLGVTSVYPNALPSGHTTAAASVAAAFLFVVPPRARPWAAVLGAAYTAATGVSTLVGNWHRPSDAVAAILVVLAWSGVACALAATSRRRPVAASVRGATPGSRTGPRPTTSGVVGGLLALVALGAAVPAGVALQALWTSEGPLSTQRELLVAYAGGALGVVATSCLAFAVMLTVRQAAGRSG
ncbi:phosphatase PAP2 family protein [Cellulomonas fimi]|uniref:Phosphatase PAP2 family protein n=1 Tax=Cellulomonas fimi TaxID=1708 RepID=A0A7Y0LXI0_CELFI|nr:phosphatase PAP2 family protein [Cellulomonas fimi]